MASIYVRSCDMRLFEECATQPKRLEPTPPVYIIEPVPQHFERLSNSERIKNSPYFHLFDNYVVGTEEGPTVLNLADHAPELASLYHFSEEIFRSWPSRAGDWRFTKTKDVEKIRLDNFIDQHNISTIEYLRIDGCQGNNFDVLKSLGDKIGMVQAGVCKSNWLTSIYDGPEDEHALNIAKFLNDNDFMVELEADGNLIPYEYSGVHSPRNHPVSGVEAWLHFKKRLFPAGEGMA